MFVGMKFNAFIIIYLFVASASAPFATVTTLSNMHGEISILKMRSISFNLCKDQFRFVDYMCPNIHTQINADGSLFKRNTGFLKHASQLFFQKCLSLRYLLIFLILNKFYSHKNHQKNDNHEIH